MRLSRFFIDRPIFAAVIAVVITVVGALAFIGLPVSQYPDIVPPTVTVSAQYPGASAETVASTVAAPIEQEINGVDDMLYQSSQSTGDGKVVITVTFKIGTDLDAAQVLVQNRVAIATPRLPEEVQRLGIVTRKTTPDFLFVVNLQSPDGSLSRDYISNYALTVRDRLARTEGVGDVQLFGARDYAMRVWIDPDRAAALDLTAGEIVSALRAQNVQVSSGSIGQPPFDKGDAFQLGVEMQGRLTTPQQFSDIVIRSEAGGRQVRVGDVARVELGAQDYGTNTYLSNKPTVVIAVMQRPGSNALEAAEKVKAEMDELSTRFPKGLEYSVIYNPTEFISQSIDAVYHTLFEAVILVVLVILVFLQNWRAAVIPVLAIPVSLIGTAAVLAALGFSLNNLSLFGLVLAIGIVVDDAIVVVENVERNIGLGKTPVEATKQAMKEVTGPIVATALVLCAVFIPTAFISGLSGQFYQQFALTIAISTVISAINSLTLSPALAAVLLKSHDAPKDRFSKLLDKLFGGWLFQPFNRVFDRASHGYVGTVKRVLRGSGIALFVYAGLMGLTYLGFATTPTGFVPAQDKQYLVAFAQLPDAATLDRTEAVMKDMSAIAGKHPGVENTIAFPGLSINGFTNSPNSGIVFVALKDFDQRKDENMSAGAIAAELNGQFGSIQEAYLAIFPPPPVQGLGTIGGFRLQVQDRGNLGYDELYLQTQNVIAKARQLPELDPMSVFTSYQVNVPQIDAAIDREKAKTHGVAISDIFDTMQIYLGSLYANDFNRFGRTYQVNVQAEQQFRLEPEQIGQLKVRNNRGEMVPLSAFLKVSASSGPDRVMHYNGFLTAEINGAAAPGYSSGQAEAAMAKLLEEELPNGMSFEWTDLTYQQILAGNSAIFVFPLCVLLAFLVLAAQYESWSLPLAVILIVPMTLLSAITGVILAGGDNNIFTQIGLIVRVGLACKNAILIVEFAKEKQEEGMDRVSAVLEACRLRLRPILMTSFAFIMGVVPLVLSSGAGAEMRHAMGVAVFSGMLGVTFFGLLLTPVFYVLIRAFVENGQAKKAARLLEVQA